MLAKNILPIAYCPVAKPQDPNSVDEFSPPFYPNKDWPDLRKNAYLQELGTKYNKSVVQVMLNWALCRGHAVIPKATSLAHQADNMNIYDFRLTAEEVEKVNELDAKERLCNKFEFCGFFDVFA